MLLNCILRPTSGTATVMGHDIIENSSNIKSNTGILAETPGLYSKLSPYEFLEFMGGIYNISIKILPSRITKLLKLFGLYDRKDHLIENFSLGMKQKLLLAASLINDPPLIFLDEPTSSLDPHASHMVKKLIKGLVKQANKTIVICSHQLPLVEELCDRIGIIDEGKIVVTGTVEEIIKKANANSLEDAFIKLTTNNESQEDIFNWRETE